MADEIKDIKVSKEELEQASQYLKELATLRGVSVNELNLSRETIRSMAREIVEGTYKKDKELIKDVKTLLKESIKEQKELKQSQQKPSVWQNLITKLKGSSSDNSFEEMYRVRQRFSGLSQMFSGNFASGIIDFAGSFKGIADIMKGPYYTTISFVIKSLLKLDNALAKATQSAIAMSGGLNSQFLNRSRWAAAAFNRDIKSDLYNIGMQDEYENIRNAMTKGYGIAAYQGQQRDFINSMAYAQKGLGAYGISADTSNSLLSNLRLLEGKNTIGIYAQLERLSKNVSAMKYFSPDQAMQQMSSLFDQTKMLGTNFEWANRAIRQFERNLKDGTATLSDFAAINKGIRSGGLSKNAGVADMIINFASRAGYNLPTELLQSDAIGRGFAISTKSVLSNNQFALATQGKIQEILNEMGGATKQDKAGRLSMLLNNWFGSNISQEVAESAIKSDGTVDLIGSKILGTRMGEREEEEAEQAKDYQKKVESYYTASTSWHNQVLNNLSQIANNTASGFDKGISGEVSSEEKTSEMIGYIIRYWGQVLGIIDKDKNAPINPTRLS